LWTSTNVPVEIRNLGDVDQKGSGTSRDAKPTSSPWLAGALPNRSDALSISGRRHPPKNSCSARDLTTPVVRAPVVVD
jgi:hypothetical protein